jgi:hypothetical protein
MARTPAQAKSLETKALANDNKSAGMRSLYEAGYTVAQVKDLFHAPYGYAYGVAQRGGYADTAASRRAPRNGSGPKSSAKATKVVARATTAKPKNAGNRARQARAQAREQKATPAARNASARAKVTKPAPRTGSTATRGRGRPPVTDPKAIAARSPEAARSAARRAAAGAATVVTPTVTRVSPKRASASAPSSAAARVAAKLQARKG